MELIVLISCISYCIGICLVGVRSGQSWIFSLVPGLSYYVRASIAQRGIVLKLCISVLNGILLYILGNIVWNSAVVDVGATLRHKIISAAEVLPWVIEQNMRVFGLRIVLQIWVNRGVAHKWGRGLLSGVELTVFPFIFWLVLGISKRNSQIGDDV